MKIGAAPRFALVVALGLAVAGCTYLGFEQGPAPLPVIAATPTDPPSPAAIKSGISAAAAAAKLTENLEASPPLRSPPSNVEPWMVCLQGQRKDDSRRFLYSAYFTGDRYDRSRMSSINERCEDQTFSPAN